jgi:hypothetical protein
MASQLSLGDSSAVKNTPVESLTDSNSNDDSQKQRCSKRGRQGNSPNTLSAVTNTEPKKKLNYGRPLHKNGKWLRQYNPQTRLHGQKGQTRRKQPSLSSIKEPEHCREEVRNLNETISKIISDKDNVYFELNKLNLIISGLPDSFSETSEQLIAKVKPFLHKIASKHFNVECSFRLGAFSNKYPRIKIRFYSLSDRNTVWSFRNMAQSPYYINEDLSLNIRQIHGKLRQQKRDILSKNPSAKLWIDWKLTINPVDRPLPSLPRSRPSSNTHSSGSPMDT